MSDRYRPTHFYFTAQDGVITWTPPTSPSNFYRYKLPAACLAEVELATSLSVRDGWGTAFPAYEQAFLAWLTKNDVARGQK